MNLIQSANSGGSTFTIFSKTLALGLSLMCVAVSGFASSITVPNSSAATEGSSNSSFPFNRLNGFTMRYQQVYDASEFGDITAPEMITQILFRPDAPFGSAFSTTLTDIQINLSTIAAGPGGLSNAFASNPGGDDTVVFSGPLSLSSAKTGPVGGPMDFDIVIDLQTPFLYDPSSGNLLIDIRNSAGTPTTGFDALSTPTGSFSRLVGFNVNNTTGALFNGGLITHFVTTPADTLLEVDIDIKFCSDPNAFNCKKRGVLPVTIFGTDSFDVTEIDPATLQLCLEDLSACTNGPRNWGIDDRGDPDTDLGASMCAVNPGTGDEVDFLTLDGYYDMDAAFEASEVQNMLGFFCSMDKESVSDTLIIIGSTLDGTAFSSAPIGNTGIDQLVKKGKPKKAKK